MTEQGPLADPQRAAVADAGVEREQGGERGCARFVERLSAASRLRHLPRVERCFRAERARGSPRFPMCDLRRACVRPATASHPMLLPSAHSRGEAQHRGAGGTRAREK